METQFNGMWIAAGPRKHVWGAHWRNLVNMIEPSICGGNAPVVKLLWPLAFYFWQW